MPAIARAALLEGAPWIWAPLLALWIVAAIVVVAHRSTRRSVGWTAAALFFASALSSVALPIVSTLAVPRVRPRAVAAPDLVAGAGDTWRKLRGPLVAMLVEGRPEVAVPTIDEQGRWILVGLLDGRPIPGLAEAPSGALEPGATRICKSGGDCRAWPSAWPDPERAPPLAPLSWTRDAAPDAVAYDVETRTFLLPSEEDDALEIVGRASEAAPRGEPRDRTTLFAIRSIADGRLRIARVVAEAAPAPAADRDGAPRSVVFRLERADVSIARARWFSRWIARPLLVVTAASLPLGVLAYAFAPALLLTSLRRRRARRHDFERPIVLVPTLEPDVAELADPIVVDGETIARGTRIRLAPATHRAGPITSRAWLEIPRLGAPLGDFVPADKPALATAASAWMSDRLGALAALAAGLAAITPAVVAALAR